VEEQYFNKCLDLAKKAALMDEIPVGAVVVYDNKIIGEGFNQRESKNLVTSHAEIEAIIEASEVIQSWKLNECDLYVTLKPCSMCESVIKQSRIKNVYYLIDRLDYKKDFSKTNFILYQNESLAENSKNILAKFFENKR